MILHSEPGHSASYSNGSAHKGQGEYFKGEIIKDPLGVGLPHSCLFRVLPEALCVNGRGTKDSLKIQISSMHGWGASEKGNLQNQTD